MNKLKLLAFALLLTFSQCDDKENGPTATANFSFTIGEHNVATNNVKVTFKNLSENATSYSWDFGDNSAGSTDENPVYSFVGGLKYNVVLTATGSNGSTSKQTTELDLTGYSKAKPQAIIKFTKAETPTTLAIKLEWSVSNILDGHSSNLKVQLSTVEDFSTTVAEESISNAKNGVNSATFLELKFNTKYYYRMLVTELGVESVVDGSSISTSGFPERFELNTVTSIELAHLFEVVGLETTVRNWAINNNFNYVLSVKANSTFFKIIKNDQGLGYLRIPTGSTGQTLVVTLTHKEDNTISKSYEFIHTDDFEIVGTYNGHNKFSNNRIEFTKHIDDPNKPELDLYQARILPPTGEEGPAFYFNFDRNKVGEDNVEVNYTFDPNQEVWGSPSYPIESAHAELMEGSEIYEPLSNENLFNTKTVKFIGQDTQYMYGFIDGTMRFKREGSETQATLYNVVFRLPKN